VHLWESGQFKPSEKKKAVIVALRKLGRREVRKLVEKKSAGTVKQTVRPSPPGGEVKRRNRGSNILLS